MSENSSPDPGSLRVGDREREDAVRLLDGHFSAGRITADEHTERTSAAYAARTRRDLDALFADLPGGPRVGPAFAEHNEADAGVGRDRCRPPWMRHDDLHDRSRPPRGLVFLPLIAVVIALLATAQGRPPVLLPVLIVAVVLLGAGRHNCGGSHHHHRHHHRPHR